MQVSHQDGDDLGLRVRLALCFLKASLKMQCLLKKLLSNSKLGCLNGCTSLSKVRR